MSALYGCIKCVDKSTKDTLKPCLNHYLPDNIGYPYDMIRAGYIWCAIDSCHYLANADRKCKNYLIKSLEENRN